MYAVIPSAQRILCTSITWLSMSRYIRKNNGAAMTVTMSLRMRETLNNTEGSIQGKNPTLVQIVQQHLLSLCKRKDINVM